MPAAALGIGVVGLGAAVVGVRLVHVAAITAMARPGADWTGRLGSPLLGRFGAAAHGTSISLVELIGSNRRTVAQAPPPLIDSRACFGVRRGTQFVGSGVAPGFRGRIALTNLMTELS